jgi:hypothetical protein
MSSGTSTAASAPGYGTRHAVVADSRYPSTRESRPPHALGSSTPTPTPVTAPVAPPPRSCLRQGEQPCRARRPAAPLRNREKHNGGGEGGADDRPALGPPHPRLVRLRHGMHRSRRQHGRPTARCRRRGNTGPHPEKGCLDLEVGGPVPWALSYARGGAIRTGDERVKQHYEVRLTLVMTTDSVGIRPEN